MPCRGLLIVKYIYCFKSNINNLILQILFLTRTRMTLTKKSTGNSKVNSSKSGNTNFNKTKYFRLRLSDEVGTERPETDLRLT